MNMNNNTNVLKKIEVGNPLYNLGLYDLYDEYIKLKTDQELIDFYFRLLDCVEGSDVSEQLAYMMISFSTGIDVNPVFTEMMKGSESVIVTLNT